jgi:hypothetical protein
MPNIVFKTKKDVAAPKTEKKSSVHLKIFANYFNWFVVLISVVVLTSGYWWLIKPKYEVVINDEAYKQQEKEYQDKVSYLKQLNEVKSLYKKITPTEKQKIDAIISAGEDIESLKINLLKEITYFGKANKVTVENFVITPLDNSSDKFISLVQKNNISVPPANLQIVTVSFSLKEIEYETLKKMLGRFEKSLRFIDITKLSYRPESKQAEIELFAYHLISEPTNK